MTDYAHTSYAERARELKAMELEELAIEAGYTAADLADDEVWVALLALLAGKRGKSRMTGSRETRTLVWRFLRDRETHRQVAS